MSGSGRSVTGARRGPWGLGCEVRGRRFHTRGDQDRERVARLAGADLHAYLFEPSAGKERGELAAGETQLLIAELGADPRLIVFAEVEDQEASARTKHPGRLRERALGVARMVQRLGEQGDV